MIVAFMLFSMALTGGQGQTVNADHSLIVELPGSTPSKSVEIAGMLVLKGAVDAQSSYPTPWSKIPSAKSVLMKVKGPIYSEFQGAYDCNFNKNGVLNHCKPVGISPNIPGYSGIMNFVIGEVVVSKDFVNEHYDDQLSLLVSVRIKDRGGKRAPLRPCLPYFCFNN